MATVQLVDGSIVENVRLTDVKHVGEEGSRSAIAHIGEHTYPVYNSIVDGFNDIWHEQMDWETYKMLGKKGIVEGTMSDEEKAAFDLAQRLQDYRVALWPSALSPLASVVEKDVVAEDATKAAIVAMQWNGTPAMGVVVVMSATQQETFYDVHLHTGQNALVYSRTAVSPRQTDKPFIWGAGTNA